MQKGVFTTAQPELDMQAKWEFCRGFAGSLMRSFADVMEAELGKEKAQQLFIKAFGQIVLDGFRQYVKDHNIPEEEHGSPVTWANFTCWFEDQGVGVVGRVTEVGPDRVVRTVDSCPWGETVFKGWSCKDYLSAAAAWPPTLYGLRFLAPKCIPDEGECEWRFERVKPNSD